MQEKLITSRNKNKIDADKTVHQALCYVLDNPCCICSYESLCNIRYKGTCEVWRKIKVKLYLALRKDN